MDWHLRDVIAGKPRPIRLMLARIAMDEARQRFALLFGGEFIAAQILPG